MWIFSCVGSGMLGFVNEFVVGGGKVVVFRVGDMVLEFVVVELIWRDLFGRLGVLDCE